MSDSELYGDDIRLWFEIQSALPRRLAAGETVINKVDWAHIAEEIEVVERADAQRQEDQQQEVARLTALLAAAEARVDDLTRELADTQAELAAVRDQAETGTPCRDRAGLSE
jgi:septal ring factor EnvC (AmiA/AmiB activator)